MGLARPPARGCVFVLSVSEIPLYCSLGSRPTEKRASERTRVVCPGEKKGDIGAQKHNTIVVLPLEKSRRALVAHAFRNADVILRQSASVLRELYCTACV